MRRAGLPALPKPGMRLASQASATIRPITNTSANTAPPMLPAVAGEAAGGTATCAVVVAGTAGLAVALIAAS
ncbi:hypothetical protein D3C85_1579100 [compost metagenome]